MSLHPQAQALLELFKGLPSPGPGTDAVQLRAQMQMPPPAAPEPVGHCEDRRIPGPGGEIPLRIYTPAGTGPFPLLMFFHGGGFVICDLDSHDSTCRALCNEAQAVVVSVDYRLAPEHPYPAAPEDCFAATLWAAEHAASLHADSARLGVAGDSAGGCLAAVVAQMARDRNALSIGFQGLIYPVTHYAFDTASYRENGEGYFLTEASMRWFWDQYLQTPAAGAEAYASPLRAASLRGLPAAAVLTAGYDPLRDEGRAYADALRAAGVDVDYRCFDSQFHGFAGMLAMIDEAREALRWIAGHFRRAVDR
ncbi:MAG TPA: alpha/beta hydrolase [Spongiibacteraceae bacterium]|jgi:acetyl esterase|nr:alpha/beta hydrolase [Spongiibacteraceae bacterium]HUH36613.1 alpha/beta hydrolase [Spongiibacteraceae bacterium]